MRSASSNAQILTVIPEMNIHPGLAWIDGLLGLTSSVMDFENFNSDDETNKFFGL